MCPSIVALESAVELIILQHPTEQKRPLGTARILSLSLANCRLLVGEDFREHDELNQRLAEPDVDFYELYPNEQAQESTKISVTTAPKTRVILLDGTWKKPTRCGKSTLNSMSYRVCVCRTSVLDITEFVKHRMIPRFRLWRRESSAPKWQPERDFSPLLKVFDAMIQYQIDQMPEGVFERNYRQ